MLWSRLNLLHFTPSRKSWWISFPRCAAKTMVQIGFGDSSFLISQQQWFSMRVINVSVFNCLNGWRGLLHFTPCNAWGITYNEGSSPIQHPTQLSNVLLDIQGGETPVCKYLSQASMPSYKYFCTEFFRKTTIM